jgi:serine/threonine-protein kinase
MGAVYKARDPQIDRFVAIKTILLHQSGADEQGEFRKRFFVEAQAAGRLLHPGIVAVFDVGEEPETSDPYIVMEYIEGSTLAELLARNANKLPLDDALRITMEVAEALDYAHAQGVVHRDIKPANILVTKDGQAKIGDFGIAQLDLSHMTLPGRVLGTPAFMSPEQLEGEQVDGRSDLFSLGAILYSAVTGFRPFQGSSVTTVCFKVANREPMQATALAPELPAKLDAVLKRVMAKDPAERYQRGREFAQDLRELFQPSSAPLKQAIWFLPREARPTEPGSSATLEQAPSHAAPSDLSKSVPTASLKGPKVQPAFLSRRVLTGVGIAVFAAAIVVCSLAWRQLRSARLGKESVVQNVSGASAVDQAPEKPSSPVAGSAVDAHPDARNETDSKGLAAAVPAAPKTVTRPVSRTGARPVPKAVAAAVSNPTPPAIADSNVEVHIDHHFSDATLAIWIDSNLTYDHPLRDGRKKRLILLGGGVKETLTIPLSAGNHTLRVQVRSATEQYDQTKSVDGEFLKGGDRILSINFEKRTKEMRVTLGGE